MKGIKVLSHSENNVDRLGLILETQTEPIPADGECVVKVHYSGVNPSDVAAVMGLFPRAIWPRYTGRDFAGTIVSGPKDHIGKEVWGTGGELGIQRNGSHAPFLVIPIEAVSEKPINLKPEEAAGIGVPFITAFEGLRRAGFPKKSSWVMIFGGNGKVGQAATQLATRNGAKVIIVERNQKQYTGFSNSPVKVVNSSETNVAEAVKEITNGHGADIVYNTIGSACFSHAISVMAHGATQVFIADRDKKEVPFNIFQFYRNQQTFAGVDTQELDVIQCARILDELRPGFEDGTLKPFPINEQSLYAIADAEEAYRKTFRGSTEKIVLKIG